MKLNLFQWLAATAAVTAIAWHERSGPWPPLRVAGAILCLTGFALVSLARYQLGRAFSVSAQARTLVTTGLYARLRNPIYAFAELFIAGLALLLESWWPVFFLLATIPVQAVRARKEAAVLEAAFGEEYRSYKSRTWF
jgi:protein-S-isoprenylcysteine O-methyltransferase Ste14